VVKSIVLPKQVKIVVAINKKVVHELAEVGIFNKYRKKFLMKRNRRQIMMAAVKYTIMM